MIIIQDGFDFYVSETVNTKGKLLLSLHSYTENFGNVPIGNKDSLYPIFNIINEVDSNYEAFAKIPKNPQGLFCILEVVCKLIKMSVQKYRPYKILELGAEQGLLSYFLTTVAKKLHPENEVHCVSGLLLNSEWLTFLQEYGEAAQNLNLHIIDSSSTSLQQNYFDFCVINNSENFPNPNEVLNNAIRVLAIGGTLVFVSKDGTISEQKISIEDKQSAHIQTAESATDLQKSEFNTLYLQMQKELEKIENLTKEELNLIVKKLSYLEKLAVILFCEIDDINLKCKLNQIKENVLNALYAPNQEIRDLFISKVKATHAQACN